MSLSEAEHEAMMDSEVCMFVRQAAADITGGNCAFIDDDIAVLTHLAHRAVKAGLYDKLHPQIQRRIAKRFASGMEAGTATTAGRGPEDDSPVVADETPKQGGSRI